MRFSAHTFGILLRLAFLCAGAAFLTLRATGQQIETPAPQTPPSTQSPRDAKPGPPPRDDAVTIEDDPTAVPDPKESADNNVSFPVDI